MKHASPVKVFKSLASRFIRVPQLLFLGILVVGSAFYFKEEVRYGVHTLLDTEYSNQNAALKKRGKELRAEVQTAYAKLRQNDAVRKENDISALVSVYIPPGTTFDDAEAILKIAGLRLGKRWTQEDELDKNSHVMNIPGRFNVVGDLILRQAIFGYDEFLVFLVPKAPWDYTVVNSVSAYVMSNGP